MNVPFRYDLPNSLSVNSSISILHRKLKKLVKVFFPYASFLETDNNRNLFTNHGLHLNKLGKQLVNYQISSLLHSTFEQKTSYPIILGWHETQDDNTLTSDKNQVKISNRNSGHKSKIPVTSNRERTGNTTACS
jgi:hypothetical protein